MKKIKIGYWIFTGLLILIMGPGSIPDIISTPDAVALFRHLGYPPYLLPFLGIAKVLAIVGILIPGFPRLKEWAYAGLFFDLTGALYSGIAIGETVKSLPLLIGHILIIGSYIFYHKKLRMQGERRTMNQRLD